MVLAAAALGLWTSLAAGAAPRTFYVVPNGNDANPGSQAQPLATLTGARDAIRNLAKAGPLPAGGIVVELAPGTYRMAHALELQSQDSGTAESPIVYRAAKRGTAILTGGAVLDDWHTVTDPEVIKRIDPTARGTVVWTNIDRQMLDELPGFANGGCGYAGKPEYPVALYQDQQRLPLARWPNEGFVKVGECIGASDIAGHEGRTFRDGIFRFDDSRMARWIGEPDLWFNGLWFHPWADEKIRLKKLDLAEKTISLANGHVFGFKKGQEFYAFNAISEIDRPGEWAIDRTGRRLYLWPAAALKKHPPVLACCESLVMGNRVAHVTFDGLVFEACRKTAIMLTNSTAVTVVASTIRHTGSWGVSLGGGQQGAVIGCDLYDLGEGGVGATGGDRTTLVPGKHLIENNHIHHFGRIVSCYRPGAAVYGVGNSIRHNLIYQSDHQAIFFDGNDHLIEYNIVHDVCLHTSDAGPLYACTRDWTKRGTVIRNNLFHAAGEGVDACGCRGIYLDDFTSGVTVTGNIVSQADAGINLGGGKDNMVTNNIAVNCATSVSLDSRGIDSFARPSAALGTGSPCYKILVRPLYRSELWTSRYPALLAPLNMDPIEAQNAHGNTIVDNLGAGSGAVRVQNAAHVMKTCKVDDNPTIGDDPGFVSYRNLDFRLRPDAPVFKLLPRFKPTEFEKMGLYNDPHRASPAVKFGSDVTPCQPILSPKDRERDKIARVFRVTRAAGSLEPAYDKPVSRVERGRDGTAAKRASGVAILLDGDTLLAVVNNPVDPVKPLSRGRSWGQDDGVELALAPVRGPGRQDVGKPFVLRGFAGGSCESSTAGGQSASDAARFGQAVQYSARVLRPGNWLAQWRIPLAAMGYDPKITHGPILAQITVFRSADRSWTVWAGRPSRNTWDVEGAWALWLEPLGELAFLPGAKPSVARVAVTWGPAKIPLQAGPGAENPGWARPPESRVEAQFGTVLADGWSSYGFEFTPTQDGLVTMELMGAQGVPPVWTYYDAFVVEGADFVNGDFETLAANGKPIGWRLPTAPGLASVLIDRASLAASGTHCVMASHDYRVTQSFRVRQGQKVTVRLRARGVLFDGTSE